jgi:hypothetical protein
MIVECRAKTEAARACLLGEVSPPVATDFVERIRAAYHSWLDEFRRSVALRLQKHAEP